MLSGVKLKILHTTSAHHNQKLYYKETYRAESRPAVWISTHEDISETPWLLVFNKSQRFYSTKSSVFNKTEAKSKKKRQFIRRPLVCGVLSHPPPLTRLQRGFPESMRAPVKHQSGDGWEEQPGKVLHLESPLEKSNLYMTAAYVPFLRACVEDYSLLVCVWDRVFSRKNAPYVWPFTCWQDNLLLEALPRPPSNCFSAGNVDASMHPILPSLTSPCMPVSLNHTNTRHTHTHTHLQEQMYLKEVLGWGVTCIWCRGKYSASVLNCSMASVCDKQGWGGVASRQAYFWKSKLSYWLKKKIG